LYDEEKPFQIFINIPEDAEDQRSSNLVFEDVRLKVQNLRGFEDTLSLDRNGFIYVTHRSQVSDFTQREVVEAKYLPEVEEIIRREVDNVSRVFFFDWRLRNTKPEPSRTVLNLNDRTSWLRPALHVHVDQSPSSALNRIRLQLKDDSEELLKDRVRIINVWRPLVPAVGDWPLAIADGSTVSPQDLVETDHIRRHYSGSTMYLQHRPGQKFYFLSNQTHEEVLLFKNFDSKKVEARYAPHASFQHPNPSNDALPRESIEVRAFVFSRSCSSDSGHG